MDPDRSLKVFKMFEKTERSVCQDVEMIKNWIKTQPHLPEIMDDIKIRNFLVLNKFSLEKTKQKIDMYYTIRSVIPDLYNNCNPKSANIRNVFETTYISVHPKALDGLYRVYFFKAKKPNAMDVFELSKLWFNIFEVKLYDECAAADIIIYDMSTTALGDVRKFTPSLVMKFWTIYQKVYALRIKDIYILNSPSYVSLLLTLFQTILKPKIFQRIKVYPDSEILKEIFDRNTLPEDYGGTGPSLEDMNGMMLRNLDEFQERFDKLDTLRVDESLRPEELNNDEILGFYGSFKKLEVD